MARKPNTQPATLYDYRRCKALCDVLAAGDEKGIEVLAEAWLGERWHILPRQHLVTLLAQHALAHGREQTS